jgi:hypothetical protein
VVVADMLDGERREAVAGAHVRCPVKQGRGRRGCEGAGSSRVAGNGGAGSKTPGTRRHQRQCAKAPGTSVAVRWGWGRWGCDGDWAQRRWVGRGCISM